MTRRLAEAAADSCVRCGAFEDTNSHMRAVPSVAELGLLWLGRYRSAAGVVVCAAFVLGGFELNRPARFVQLGVLGALFLAAPVLVRRLAESERRRALFALIQSQAQHCRGLIDDMRRASGDLGGEAPKPAPSQSSRPHSGRPRLNSSSGAGRRRSAQPRSAEAKLRAHAHGPLHEQFGSGCHAGQPRSSAGAPARRQLTLECYPRHTPPAARQARYSQWLAATVSVITPPKTPRSGFPSEEVLDIDCSHFSSSSIASLPPARFSTFPYRTSPPQSCLHRSIASWSLMSQLASPSTWHVHRDPSNHRGALQPAPMPKKPSSQLALSKRGSTSENASTVML